MNIQLSSDTLDYGQDTFKAEAFKRIFDRKLTPKKQKAVIFFFMGFTPTEIADITGDSLNIIECRLQQSFKTLKTNMRKYNER